MEGISAEIIITLVNKMDQVCVAVTNLEREVARMREEITTVKSELREEITTVKSELKEEIVAVRSELKEEMVVLETNLKNEIKFQINKSNSELSDYMVKDIIQILNDLDRRMRVVETKTNSGTVSVAEDSTFYESESKNC